MSHSFRLALLNLHSFYSMCISMWLQSLTANQPINCTELQCSNELLVSWFLTTITRRFFMLLARQLTYSLVV